MCGCRFRRRLPKPPRQAGFLRSLAALLGLCVGVSPLGGLCTTGPNPHFQVAGTNLVAASAFTAYDGSRSCAKAGCHSTAPVEVAGSLHYQLKATASNVTGYESSLLGMLNDYCALPGALATNNWLALLQPANTNRGVVGAGCALCHVGNGNLPNPPGQLTQDDYDSVDCLVCHAPNYARAVVLTNGQLKVMPAPGVDVVAAMQRVQRPDSSMCLRCHLSAGGGPNFKRGESPSPETDVHLAAGLECVDCHSSTLHHVAGAGDLKGVDAPGAKVECAECHGATPHQGNAAIYNTHAKRVACQTCHIPLLARSLSLPTLVQQDLTSPVLNPATGLFEPAHQLATNVVPVYRWWNGKVQKYPPAPLGAIQDPDAKIYPWKHIRADVPADTSTGARLPLDASTYAVSGSVAQSVADGARESGLPYSGSWTRTTDELYYSVQHQVAPPAQALTCGDCHAPLSRMDFAALGYDTNRVAFLQSSAPWKGTAHTGRLGSAYTGPGSCTQCHAGKVEEVMDSVHYTWRTPNPKVTYPGGGSHGMLDRIGALAGASAMANYSTDVASGCGKCHIGQDVPLPNLLTGKYSQTQKDGLDCLLCHAAAGQYDMNGDGRRDALDAEALERTLVTAPSGQRTWYQDRSLTAAESVGGPVSTEACLRCHQHLQGEPAYKRGTPYSREHDVHAAAGLLCTECHLVDHHKIARGSRVADLHGWERQDVEVDCTRCHSSSPHPQWPSNPAFVPYNEHAAFIACQTCHIPWVSGVSRQVWTSTLGATNGPEAFVPLFNPTNGLFEPFTVLTGQTRPTYRWFNGNASMMAEAVSDPGAWYGRVATKATPGVKIHPFRLLVNGLVVDRRGMQGSTNYAPEYTLGAAFERMQAPLKTYGMMRSEGLTAAERAALSQMPNLLDFDLQAYVQTGKTKDAVDIGMGRVSAILSGQNASQGSNLWSGELAGLDLPNNPSDPTCSASGDPTQATGSLISLNHAIEWQSALKCMDCHSVNSVMDYRALSYTPAQAERLKTLFDKLQFISLARTASGLQLRWSCVPGHTYQLLSASELKPASWNRVGAPTRTISFWMQYVVPQSAITNSARTFFRVQDVTP